MLLHESELYYFCRPTGTVPVNSHVDILDTTELLRDEIACKILWELIDTQFKTRSKFFAIWSSVRFIALHRDDNGIPDGFLLISAPVNWQIDYVVVRPDSRGQGIASNLVKAAVSEAYVRKVPYVMLTSRESLRPLYESCGFEVVKSVCPV